MSRSYKKNPVIKTAPTDGSEGKRFANKKVRKYNAEISNGNSYRKIYNSWDIHDGIGGISYQSYEKDYEGEIKAYINGGLRYNPYKYKNSHYDWYKTYKRK